MIYKDMAPTGIAHESIFVKTKKDGAKEILNDFIEKNRGMITASIQGRLKIGEVVERVSAKSLVFINLNESQGAVVEMERMSIAQKFRILDRTMGRRKINFSETICGQRIILDIRVLILKN